MTPDPVLATVRQWGGKTEPQERRVMPVVKAIFDDVNPRYDTSRTPAKASTAPHAPLAPAALNTRHTALKLPAPFNAHRSDVVAAEVRAG